MSQKPSPRKRLEALVFVGRRPRETRPLGLNFMLPFDFDKKWLSPLVTSVKVLNIARLGWSGGF
jgi:hypothetical protein